MSQGSVGWKSTALTRSLRASSLRCERRDREGECQRMTSVQQTGREGLALMSSSMLAALARRGVECRWSCVRVAASDFSLSASTRAESKHRQAWQAHECVFCREQHGECLRSCARHRLAQPRAPASVTVRSPLPSSARAQQACTPPAGCSARLARARRASTSLRRSPCRLASRASVSRPTTPRSRSASPPPCASLSG